MSIYFHFKKEVEDFCVEEELLSQPCGYGDFHYFLVEKRQMNTMELISQLLKHFPLKREDLGITGLKDKQGITKQRISISKKNLKKIGGSTQFSSFLEDFVLVLKKDQHHEPLAIGKNKGNRFQIRLRAHKPLNTNQKQLLESNIIELQERGFPNAFGIQRFGKGNKNFKKASKIFENGIDHSASYEVRFKLQAYGSMRFNEYVMQRWEQGTFLIDGDVMVNKYHAFGAEVASYHQGKLHHFDYWKCKEKFPHTTLITPQYESFITDYDTSRRCATGPVLGYNQLVCTEGSAARARDNKLLEWSKFLQNYGPTICKRYQLYGFRRALWVKPQNLQYQRENDNLLLSFSLPTGAYASVFLAQLLASIDPQGCISNGLTIPRPELQKDIL